MVVWFVHKTVPIETNVSEFGATFFPQPDRPCFFQSLGEKNKKQKFVTRKPGETMGGSGDGSLLCLRSCAFRTRKGISRRPWYFVNSIWGACSVITVTVQRHRGEIKVCLCSILFIFIKLSSCPQPPPRSSGTPSPQGRASPSPCVPRSTPPRGRPRECAPGCSWLEK